MFKLLWSSTGQYYLIQEWFLIPNYYYKVSVILNYINSKPIKH